MPDKKKKKKKLQQEMNLQETKKKEKTGFRHLFNKYCNTWKRTYFEILNL